MLEPSHNHRSLAIVQGSLTHFEMKRVFVFPIWSMPTLLGRKRSLVAQVSVPVGSNEPSPSTHDYPRPSPHNSPFASHS